MPTRMDKMDLIQAIWEATEGKFYVEIEFARCTWRYAEMKEEDGEMRAAADVILDVQVETYGSMQKEEKLNYILYQMRLVLDLKDYVRSQIIMKKIQRWNLNDAGLEQIKVRYFELSIRYYIHEKDHLETAKCFQIIFDTVNGDKVAEFDDNHRATSFQAFVSFLMITQYSHETVDLLHIVNTKYFRELEKYPVLEKYVHWFL